MVLPYRPGEVYQGKIIYLYPYVDPKTRQIQVRAGISQSHAEAEARDVRGR